MWDLHRASYGTLAQFWNCVHQNATGTTELMDGDVWNLRHLACTCTPEKPLFELLASPSERQSNPMFSHDSGPDLGQWNHGSTLWNSGSLRLFTFIWLRKGLQHNGKWLGLVDVELVTSFWNHINSGISFQFKPLLLKWKNSHFKLKTLSSWSDRLEERWRKIFFLQRNAGEKRNPPLRLGHVMWCDCVFFCQYVSRSGMFESNWK